MRDVTPFTSDTYYRTPSPASDLERLLLKAALDGRFDDARRLLQNDVTSTIGGGLLDQVVRQRNFEFLVELLRFPRWCFDYSGAVAVAAYCDDLESMKVLLNDRRIDCNIGLPVCVCVAHNRVKCLTELLRCDRVNPNRGNPLVLAADNGDLVSLKLLCDCPTVHPNKFSSNGSTALLSAIRRNDQQMACYLLSNLRVDPNKGFCCTPLQLAAQLGREECCQLLLARSSTAPNGVIGNLPSPLQLAVESENVEISRLLLTDTRIVVHDGVIDFLEANNKINLLQLLISTQHFRVGKLWSLRTGAFFCATFLLLLIFCFDLLFVILAAQTAAGLSVLLIHCFSGMIAFFFVKRKVASATSRLLPIVLPFFPLFEVSMLIAFVQNLVVARPDLTLREIQFVLLEHCASARTLFMIAPLLLVRMVTIGELSARPLGAAVFSTVLYAGFFGVLFWIRRVHMVVQRKQYVALQEVV